MRLEFLDEKHPSYDASVATWRECDALYAGGDKFKALLETFLPKNPSEPYEVYETRKIEAAYSSYLGPIVDYFTSWLFSGSFTVRAKAAGSGTQATTPEFYTEFENDIGGDVRLDDFMRERFTRAQIEGCSYWLIVMPSDDGSPATDRATWEQRQLGRASLRPIEREQLYDWDVDAQGKLTWCSIHTIESLRKTFASKRNMIRETWDVYDRTDVKTYSFEYEVKKRPKVGSYEVPLVASRPHGCAEVPLASLHIKDGMWVGDRVRAPQIEHFRLSCANSWLIRRTCYAMPVLNLEDANSIPVMGAGYYIAIGVNEKFGWSSPPNTPFDVIAKETSAKRDEIFRIVHQMAQGMDNNAETVGRSADSKGLDVAATRIMLNAYGAMVRRAIEETYEIISDAREDEDLFWSVEGFNGFDTTSAADLIATAANAQLMGIPSATFAREIKTKVALAMLPEVDSHVKDDIRREIKAATDVTHLELDDLNMNPAERMKIELQKMKDATALKLQDKKSKTTIQVQEIKAADVRLEVQMASGKAGLPKPVDGKGADHVAEHAAATSKTPPSGALNLIKADS